MMMMIMMMVMIMMISYLTSLFTVPVLSRSTASTCRLFLSLLRSEDMKPSYFRCLKSGGMSLTSSTVMTSLALAA